jgi:hypothetical protein
MVNALKKQQQVFNIHINSCYWKANVHPSIYMGVFLSDLLFLYERFGPSCHFWPGELLSGREIFLLSYVPYHIFASLGTRQKHKIATTLWNYDHITKSPFCRILCFCLCATWNTTICWQLSFGASVRHTAKQKYDMAQISHHSYFIFSAVSVNQLSQLYLCQTYAYLVYFKERSIILYW